VRLRELGHADPGEVHRVVGAEVVRREADVTAPDQLEAAALQVAQRLGDGVLLVHVLHLGRRDEQHGQAGGLGGEHRQHERADLVRDLPHRHPVHHVLPRGEHDERRAAQLLLHVTPQLGDAKAARRHEDLLADVVRRGAAHLAHVLVVRVHVLDPLLREEHGAELLTDRVAVQEDAAHPLQHRRSVLSTAEQGSTDILVACSERLSASTPRRAGARHAPAVRFEFALAGEGKSGRQLDFVLQGRRDGPRN